MFYFLVLGWFWFSSVFYFGFWFWFIFWVNLVLVGFGMKLECHGAEISELAVVPWVEGGWAVSGW